MLHRSVLNPRRCPRAPPSAGPSVAAAEPGRRSAGPCQTGAAAKPGWCLPGLGLDSEPDRGVEQMGGADHPEQLTEGQPFQAPTTLNFARDNLDVGSLEIGCVSPTAAEWPLGIVFGVFG